MKRLILIPVAKGASALVLAVGIMVTGGPDRPTEIPPTTPVVDVTTLDWEEDGATRLPDGTVICRAHHLCDDGDRVTG